MVREGTAGSRRRRGGGRKLVVEKPPRCAVRKGRAIALGVAARRMKVGALLDRWGQPSARAAIRWSLRVRADRAANRITSTARSRTTRSMDAGTHSVVRRRLHRDVAVQRGLRAMSCGCTRSPATAAAGTFNPRRAATVLDRVEADEWVRTFRTEGSSRSPSPGDGGRGHGGPPVRRRRGRRRPQEGRRTPGRGGDDKHVAEGPFANRQAGARHRRGVAVTDPTRPRPSRDHLLNAAAGTSAKTSARP